MSLKQRPSQYTAIRVKFITSLLLMAVVAFGGLTGCKSQSKAEKQRKAALAKKAKLDLREENPDVDFQAFVEPIVHGDLAKQA